MPSAVQMLEQVAKGNPLYVVHQHAQWLEMTEAEQYELLDEQREIIQPALEALIFGRRKRPRTRRIGASGLGLCKRKQLFSYAGAPGIGEDPDSSDLMSMGTHDHLWWQLEGLAMGWLVEVEPFFTDGFVGGSLDGVGPEVGVFELKTVREGKFTKIVQVEKDPLWEHKLQLDFYQEHNGDSPASLVYQHRDGGSYYEFRVERDPAVAKERELIVEELGNHVADDTLPAMLEDCEMRQGTVYKQCAYRKYCPLAQSVTVKE